MNSDVLTNFDIEQLYLKFIESGSDLTVAAKDYRVDIPFGVLNSESSNLKSIKEKPSFKFLCNSGIYMFNKQLINHIPKENFFNATDLITILLDKKYKLTTHEILGFWYDIGTPENFNDAKKIVNFKF